MKKVILLLMLVQQIAQSQNENSIFPAEPYSTLNAIAVSGDYIYTAGDCNTALVSIDEGANWTVVTVDDRVRNVRIVPESNGTKAIYQYKNSLQIFDINTMLFEEVSSSSLFLSSGNYISVEVDGDNIYVISNQNVHKATIGEYSWSKVADFNTINDGVVMTDITDNALHIGTLNGLLLRLDLNTEAVNTMNDFQNRIYSFDMVSDDLGYFTIQNFPHPIKTTDGGLTHSELDNLPENIGVRGYGENIVFTVNTNRMYVSTDGGQTSTYIPYPDDGSYDLIYATFITDDGVLYFSGNSSTVAKTEDFGSSFINLNDYKRENLVDIEVNENGTAVAVGGNSTIIKSNDGGQNWEQLDLLEVGQSNNYLNAVAIISESKYLVAGSSMLSIIENDQITNSIPSNINAMTYNSDAGYLIGLQSSNGDHSIIKSTDDGVSWESKAFLPSYSYQMSQSPSGKIFVPSSEGNIYTSTDAGETWDIETFGNELEVWNILFLNENIGIASTGNNLYKTTDGGVTASLIASGYAINNLQFISESHIIYTTATNSQTNLYESVDGGSNFQLIKEYCSSSQATYKDKDNVIWFAQKGGHINKFAVQQPTSTANIPINNIDLYPNPVSADQDLFLAIEGKISELIITSVSGKVVYQSTSASNIISTQLLSPGLYNLSIKTTNGDLKRGKFVIAE